MCVYPRLIINKKFLPNKKNGGNPPQYKDIRTTIVPIGCGKCIECRKQYARDWKVRLSEELYGNRAAGIAAQFVTLTFSEEALNKYLVLGAEDDGELNENKAATKAVRHFLERWRKDHKKSLRHWLITELGHDGTERLHLHGILFSNEITKEVLEKYWKNGWCHVGEYCNERTINYIMKYITKIDNDHPNFSGKILCSAGIGNFYIKSGKGDFNTFRNEKTKDYYKTKEGFKLALPIYYRNWLFTEEEREQLWINRLNENKTWLLGVEYDLKNNNDILAYQRALKSAQKTSNRNGYGKIEWNWDIYCKGVRLANKIH